jgi:hypothetical protein
LTENAIATKRTLNVLEAGKGDLTVEWDNDNETEVNLAREAFARAKSNGYLAYKVVDGENEQIREFDPDATRIVMTPQLVGG